MCFIGDVELLQNLHVYNVDCKIKIDVLYNQPNEDQQQSPPQTKQSSNS